MVKETGLPKNPPYRNRFYHPQHYESSKDTGQGDGMLHQLLHR